MFPQLKQNKTQKKLEWIKNKSLRTHTQNRPSATQQQGMWLFVVLVVATLAALTQIRTPDRTTAQQVAPGTDAR